MENLPFVDRLETIETNIELFNKTRANYLNSDFLSKVHGEIDHNTEKFLDLLKYISKILLEDLSFSDDKNSRMLKKELEGYVSSYPYEVELQQAFDSKNLEIYEDQIKKLFRHYKSEGFTYDDMMRRQGVISGDDMSKVHEVMEFFKTFKSSAKPLERSTIISIDEYRKMVLEKNTFWSNGVKRYSASGEGNFCGYLMDKYKGNVNAQYHPAMCTKFNETDGIKTIQSIQHEFGHLMLRETLRNHITDNKIHCMDIVSVAMDEAHAFLNQFYIYPNSGQCKYSDYNNPIKHERRIFNSPHFYNEHVSVRYEFEKSMMDNPEQDPQKLLTDISMTILGHDTSLFQDVHWTHAHIGYFPAYAVGHVIAAQLYESKYIPFKNDIEKDFKLSEELDILDDNEFIQFATGNEINVYSFERFWR